MHQSSYERMRSFRDRFLSPDAVLRIADLGSLEVNGSYRDLFLRPGWTYLGLDLTAGPNVDIVLQDPYRWAEIPDASLDVVISGQALEHMEFFWLAFEQMTVKLKPGGLACIIAPSRGPEHRYPVDCWRFYPDGFRALAKWAGLELLEVSTQWEPETWNDQSDWWGDTCGVFRKSSSRTK